MVGPTPAIRGRLIRLAPGMPSPPKRCSGRTPTKTALGTSRWGRSGTTAPPKQGPPERDLQGCPDDNGDGWSNQYGEFAAAIAIMGEDPAASWLTYAVMGAGFLLGALGALLVKGTVAAENSSNNSFTTRKRN